MKMDMLKEALNMMYARGDHEPEIKAEIKSALEELQTTMDLWGDRADNYELEARLVPEESMAELININLYNMYGRMMRENRNLVEFDLFVCGCRGGSVYADGFEYLSDKALRGGYEFIRDLWQDNESNGSNNPDGTFDAGKFNLSEMAARRDNNYRLKKALSDYRTAGHALTIEWDKTLSTEWYAPAALESKYPFEKSFDELLDDVDNWVEDAIEKL